MAASGDRGFTLMEVLVAVAICGISLGVALSGLSQGHRATERALSMERAGGAMEMALLKLASMEDEDLEMGRALEGEIPGMEGWKYSVEVRPLSIKLVQEDNDTEEGEDGLDREDNVFQDEELQEIEVKVLDPRGHSYSLILWQ